MVLVLGLVFLVFAWLLLLFDICHSVVAVDVVVVSVIFGDVCVVLVLC